MDEDFGTSIWATATTATSSIVPLSSPVYPTFTQSSFDLDDIGAQNDDSGFGDDDDDFGDFGEFGQAESTTEEIGNSGHFSEPAVSVAGSSSWVWEPLHFDPHPSRHTLEAQIEEILGPLWNTDDTSQVLTDEDVREVGGLAQILVTPDR
jgi:DNA-directed RNA polymerase I subunit RPA1